MRRQFGQAGHLIVASKCQFHLHTHIGKWCISTIGEYFPGADDSKPTEIGYNRLYETMVFNTKSKFGRWQEKDSGSYNTRAAANEGHETMCRKYEGTT